MLRTSLQKSVKTGLRLSSAAARSVAINAPRYISTARIASKPQALSLSKRYVLMPCSIAIFFSPDCLFVSAQAWLHQTAAYPIKSPSESNEIASSNSFS